MESSMAKLCLPILLVLLSVNFTLSADPPTMPPNLAPQPAADAPQLPFPPEAAASPPSSSASPENSPVTAPSTTPESSPAPAPNEASDINHIGANEDGEESGGSGGGGMSGGKKAGIVVGVILAATVVGVGGFVYKKRQNNIRRSQYGYGARREML